MATEQVSYNGQGFSLLGEKGRFVLPPDFRKAVRDSGGGERVLCLARHHRWKCLTGFGIGRVPQLQAELDAEHDRAIKSGLPFDRETREAQLHGFTRVPFDDSGRFVLPERYFRQAGIETRIYFQGGGRAFTIWAPAELAKMGEGWEDAQAACADYEAALTAKGAK